VALYKFLSLLFALCASVWRMVPCGHLRAMHSEAGVLGAPVLLVCAGIVRGSGQQQRGSLINLIAFYFFGLPAAYLLAFWPLQLGVVVSAPYLHLPPYMSHSARSWVFAHGSFLWVGVVPIKAGTVMPCHCFCGHSPLSPTAPVEIFRGV